jgi:hypothetical protein
MRPGPCPLLRVVVIAVAQMHARNRAGEFRKLTRCLPPQGTAAMRKGTVSRGQHSSRYGIGTSFPRV